MLLRVLNLDIGVSTRVAAGLVASRRDVVEVTAGSKRWP
jgi:hypothetical protein